ncbi:MAG: hypothetical protein Q8M95_02630 [Candidatus Methanoperedens sp.]|nr:hypothetical protein [Candidatus Methanoperedens sp.]
MEKIVFDHIKPQISQSSAIPVTAYETAPPSRRGTRMTQIARIFTDQCASASTVAPVDVAHTYGSRHTWSSAFHRHSSAFIMPKPCGFSTPRTRMPCGAYVDTPSRGVTLGAFISFHPRLILSRNTQEALAV